MRWCVHRHWYVCGPTSRFKIRTIKIQQKEIEKYKIKSACVCFM